jgi:hypothetical protein
MDSPLPVFLESESINDDDLGIRASRAPVKFFSLKTFQFRAISVLSVLVLNDFSLECFQSARPGDVRQQPRQRWRLPARPERSALHARQPRSPTVKVDAMTPVL